MRYLLLLLLALCAVPVFAAEDLTAITGAGGTIYFAHDFENGALTPDAGAGSYSSAGGNVAGQPGPTGCDNTATYHNTIIASDTAISGTKALKTPYSGICPGEASIRDITSINTGTNLYEGYARWYQKFTGDWNSASGSGAQHKFTKFNSGDGTLPVVHFSFAAGGTNWRNFLPNIDGHFDKDGVTRYNGQLWVYNSSAAAGTPYTGQNVSYDDYDNGIGGTDGDIHFVPGQWYAMEFHWKVNTDADTADAVAEAWVDGVKVFGVSNFKYFNSGTRPYVRNIEMQHIYYNRSANDQPTYVDNIVVADRAIGLLNGEVPPDAIAPITTPSKSGGRYSTRPRPTLTASSGTSTVYCLDFNNTCTPSDPYTSAIELLLMNTAGPQYLRYKTDSETVKSDRFVKQRRK